MTTQDPTKPPRGLQWPIFIVALLGLNVLVCTITIVSAVRNPAEIEPDYYDRALNWDETRAAATDSD